jgi:hypothetical protein
VAGVGPWALRELLLRGSSLGNRGAHALAEVLAEEALLPCVTEVDVRSTLIVKSEKLRRTKARLMKLRPGLAFLYEQP